MLGGRIHAARLGRRGRRYLPVVVALTALTLPVARASAASPDLVFTSSRDGDSEIYAMNDDGTGIVQLTDDPAQDVDPVWSPDGRRIAFSSNRDGDFEIYVMNDDGSQVQQLTSTDGSGVDRRPAWSPDGSEILFDRPFNPTTGVHLDLYAVNVATGAVRRLTNGGGVSSGGGEGDWAPRPHVLLQRHTDHNDWEIGRLDPATGSVTQLTSNAFDDLAPSWFPDGSRVAFASSRSGSTDIWTMASDGTGAVRLTTASGTEYGPQVSCDGSRIAYHTNQDGNYEIYVMDADGSNQTRLTDDPGTDSAPRWRCLQNAPPGLGDDVATTAEDTTLDVAAPGVLANDADPDGDAFTIELDQSPTHGDVSLLPDGSFTYIPHADYHGTDLFRYRATDAYGATAVAGVSITVTPVNDAPVANPDSASTPQYEPVSIDVLANDTDVDGDPLTVTAVSAPVHGEASIEDGKLTYVPGPTFKDTDAFEYTIADGAGGTAQATVTVTALGCGEDGLEALHATPLDGAASRTVDREIEPLVGYVDPGAAEAVHDVNCTYVVPAEDGAAPPGAP